MLQRFFKLISEVKDFMESKGKPIPQLSDKKWVADLAFMVDIAEHLSDLNLKLQGRNQLVNVLFSHIKSFKGKLCLWESQLRRNNYSSFPALPQHSNNAVIEKYADEIKFAKCVCRKVCKLSAE